MDSNQTNYNAEPFSSFAYDQTSPDASASDLNLYSKGNQSPYVNLTQPVTSAQLPDAMYRRYPTQNPPSCGVPMFPLYGYDNSDDLDQDLDCMRNMYPQVIQIIQVAVEDECDKLEYDGSCMFDETPDKNHLAAIINVIYKKIENLDQDNPSLQSEQLSPFVPPYIYGRCYGINCPRVPYYNQYGRPNWLRNIVEVLLYNEMLNRRRRYRSRRRWY